MGDYKNLDKFIAKHGIYAVHEDKMALKDSKKDKDLKQDDYNELIEKIATDLGYL